MEEIEARLTATDDNDIGLEVVSLPEKGRGVIATKNFAKCDFVVEYAGELIDNSDANKREVKYSMDVNKGCYMYYFQHKGEKTVLVS